MVSCLSEVKTKERAEIFVADDMVALLLEEIHSQQQQRKLMEESSDGDGRSKGDVTGMQLDEDNSKQCPIIAERDEDSDLLLFMAALKNLLQASDSVAYGPVACSAFSLMPALQYGIQQQSNPALQDNAKQLFYQCLSTSWPVVPESAERLVAATLTATVSAVCTSPVSAADDWKQVCVCMCVCVCM